MDHIFTIWITDKDWGAMPFLDELCIASAQVMNKKPITIYSNHELHFSFLDRTITKVERIPENWMREAEQIDSGKAHQSDYIRLKLLQEKGGIYFDTDILFWDSFDKLWDAMTDYNKPVLYVREDANMICNCIMMCKEPLDAKEFFDDMLDNYRTRFIHHSYLFNSQKMMNLMSRRYSLSVLIYDEQSVFGVPWNDAPSKLWTEERKGIGQHLYTSLTEWRDTKLYLDNHCYDKTPDNAITILLANIIDSYISLMKEGD